MQGLSLTAACLVLVSTALLMSSCGTGSQGTGQLQSIIVTPASVDAPSANFTATGVYVNPEHTLTPQPALWGACFQGAPTTSVTVSKTGAAQCVSGASGTYTVFADVETNCTFVNACGGGCTTIGTAQLTCP
jgi:hypothetical protein